MSLFGVIRPIGVNSGPVTHNPKRICQRHIRGLADTRNQVSFFDSYTRACIVCRKLLPHLNPIRAIGEKRNGSLDAAQKKSRKYIVCRYSWVGLKYGIEFFLRVLAKMIPQL